MLDNSLKNIKKRLRIRQINVQIYFIRIMTQFTQKVKLIQELITVYIIGSFIFSSLFRFFRHWIQSSFKFILVLFKDQMMDLTNYAKSIYKIKLTKDKIWRPSNIYIAIKNYSQVFPLALIQISHCLDGNAIQMNSFVMCATSWATKTFDFILCVFTNA